MKLVVFPEARRAQVEAVVRETLGPHRGGTDELTLTIMRMTMERRWSVQVTGLNDPVLERGWCEVIEHALKEAGI
jgi:hypothetical protein